MIPFYGPMTQSPSNGKGLRRPADTDVCMYVLMYVVYTKIQGYMKYINPIYEIQNIKLSVTLYMY